MPALRSCQIANTKGKVACDHNSEGTQTRNRVGEEGKAGAHRGGEEGKTATSGLKARSGKMATCSSSAGAGAHRRRRLLHRRRWQLLHRRLLHRSARRGVAEARARAVERRRARQSGGEQRLGAEKRGGGGLVG
jgi:hypothetical protein